MGDLSNKRPKTVWIGAGISAILFGLFWYLESAEPSLLELQPQWILVALVPLGVSLILGGYICELKAGDYGVDFTGKILAKSEPVDDGRLSTGKPSQFQSVTGWLQDRVKEYERTRGYMLAHVYRPSKVDGQKFDISIFVVQHRKGTVSPPRDKLDELAKAEFFFGDSWGNNVFEVGADNGFFGVRTHAWGTFLATCRITFKDANKVPIVLYRYIDFSMAADE